MPTSPGARGKPRTTRRGALLAVLLLTMTMVAASPARSDDPVPQIARGILLPVGFGLNVFAETPGLLPASIAWGPDSRGGDDERLYVVATDPNLSTGRVLAFDDLGGIAGPPQSVVPDLLLPLGIAFGPDGTMYVSENENGLDGPGRVRALQDTDGDGVFDESKIIIRNLPGGRHQTNDLEVGPDGWLYITNGNATDNGLECGPPDGAECTHPEVLPWTGAILRVDPAWEDVDLLNDVDMTPVTRPEGFEGIYWKDVLVAEGFRNIYDVAFWPGDPSWVYTAMNGSDFPASSDPLFRTQIDDTEVVGVDENDQPVHEFAIDDMGFPSCLYNPHHNTWPVPDIGGHDHSGDPEPQENLNPAVIEEFGPCDKDRVTRPVLVFHEGHEGTAGLAFEDGSNFPERYQHDLFVAEWGSIWNTNGGLPTGHKLMHIEIGPDGLPGGPHDGHDEHGHGQHQREFMTGAFPIDVTFGPDGAMYVADFHGLIYRVVHVLDTPDTATVEMIAGQFVPQVVFIPKNVRVLWLNMDEGPHNVRADRAVVIGDPASDPVIQPGTEIDSPGDVPPGDSHLHQFGNNVGMWMYRSTTTATDEATMHGSVVVLPLER